MKNLPVWKRQLIGWPILIGLIFAVAWLLTGHWFAGILVILFLLGVVMFFGTVIALVIFVSWMFGDNGKADTCSY